MRGEDAMYRRWSILLGTTNLRIKAKKKNGGTVGGKRRIFNFFESAPDKGFCKPLKTENFPLSLSLKNSKKPKTWFGTRGGGGFKSSLPDHLFSIVCEAPADHLDLHQVFYLESCMNSVVVAEAQCRDRHNLITSYFLCFNS
jgi:hypothetical protein